MKKKLIITPAFLFFVMNCHVLGVSQPLHADNSNYVVIGAFAYQDNATHFVENVKKLKFKAEFAINPARKLYYVYVLHTGNVVEAIAEARKIRTETPFNDTWVYKGLLGENNSGQIGTDVNPITEQKLSQVEVEDHSQIEKSSSANKKIVDPEISKPIVNPAESQTVDPAVHQNPNAPSNLSQSDNAVVKDEKNNKVDEAEKGKGFIFKISTGSGALLKGEVDLIDADRLAKAASYEGNKQVYIKPLNKSGKITVICEVFGYRKVQKELNYNLPDSTSGVKIENGNTVVPFELIRLRKGDIAVMYNVYFFKDAAIMRPESRYEVTSLLEMMNENPNYKIKLHGHTNGGAAGKIIRMGETANFFSLNGGKDGFGSAKELSESRAELIRDFLIAEGIDAKRLIVKAWGGKKPIQDKGSNKASENVRVEAEILED